MRTLKQLRTYEVALDKAGFGPVAGIDEAGRGACFGPITIAACVLPPQPLAALDGLTDSKKLTAKRREELYGAIVDTALAQAVVHIPAAEIDCRGIQNANLDGARRAVAALGTDPGYVLVDAFRVPGLTSPQLPVIGGDYTARCIAAASVLAKVSRDRLVTQMGEEYPGYGVEKHKGYSTRAHMDAVRRHGASAEHRYTYANVAAAHEMYMRSTHDER
ncbi:MULTISPECIES: ribonuclease HII [unclassified Corynebacterium]|uniref:ribonuclease HII n=1 Tax=unclassified Corynebacterium TaxID=2624378 RepID=UPI00264C7FA9|nr:MULTISPECIES: ribonuclease HII [unclassified Corynebacterium]MDN8593694.1 ribonuclease HII [Corynebacterium sp. P4_F2]WKK55811.1 ribonuclease HII [Corynebacterium sp. P4-C1]WKK63219.1 ribonuclease HII [Corynebacterium sp. P8-C1]